MSYQIDPNSGTGVNPCRVPFSGKKTAIICVAFVDGEKALVEGAATGAQAKFRTSLQLDGYDVSDARFVATLEAEEGVENYVDFALHVGKNVEEEPPA